MALAKLIDRKAEEMQKQIEDTEKMLIEALDRMEKSKMEMSELRETIREFLNMKKSV